ncbi:hypothetical protein, unknown function [Leishmania mexicana MHOM/GT/2001/U1103]|uniref:Uncharacterized protein n=1 Tax=Leishmania mexicana (strain MHOM/GT/2001/U1103) TaxID=929439 RepID=E9B2A1_LEIMU|nr:hypothetical protein, unknown function [Leishmania mexicana MHOM/GT/2001/U1103]CBZ29363.1 hypothetical protein, unknown function [Leishmania mexicana MHOM/GT/2001/U1103]
MCAVPPPDINTVMSDRYEFIETSLQFSSSSGFSTLLPPIDEEACTDVRVLVVAKASSGKRQGEKGSGTHARSLQRVVPPSFLHNEAAAGAYVGGQLSIHRGLTASSSRLESSNGVHDSATATGDSEYYFLSTIRGSTSPPGMSTYFGGAVASAAPVARVADTAMSLMSDIESFEDIETPRSIDVSAPAAAQVSRTVSPSPPTMSLHSHKMGSRGDLLPAEVVVVNAEEARAAHALLTSSAAAIIARYRLVKFKVVQRIYRIYYDKWRWEIFQSTSAVPPLHVTEGIQASALSQRSASAGTEFADIDSFHTSRSMSLSGDSPGVHIAVTISPRDAQPLRSTSATSTPSPQFGEGESERGISVTWSPAPAFQLETFASASPPPPSQPSKHRTPTFSIPPPAPPTDGIAVRTKPAKLVDFGRPSEGPKRKRVHLASTPAVNLPAVVPSPERIFRC